ncbi:unnamed protein product [Adineta steineri]|uniref:Uncharacterized protein n=1 Tax=Adineta steineri TaxID=433720 RepID=A0A814G104_9BILA|nr:unnamed protein product [Adineta steineri]CAF0994972.1 unnamed protein product [Adineta steineri]
MSTYKLYTFNSRSRAEIARLMFIAADQKFEDIRYECKEWISHKNGTPFKLMPILEVDGVKLSRSVSIGSFLANRFQLGGKDNLEQATIEDIFNALTALMKQFLSFRDEKDLKKRVNLIKNFFVNELPRHLQNVEVLAKQYANNGPFLVGKNLTWVDLFFYEVTETLFKSDRTILDNYLFLKQNHAEVEKQPRIGEYLKNRSKS